jgi:excinuclease ABC subunit A
LDVIKSCDCLIDLGPEGGAAGGEIIAQGTPEEVAKNLCSYTGMFLQKIFSQKAEASSDSLAPT